MGTQQGGWLDTEDVYEQSECFFHVAEMAARIWKASLLRGLAASIGCPGRFVRRYSARSGLAAPAGRLSRASNGTWTV